MECQQNRVNIPHLRSPLSRQPLGRPKIHVVAAAGLLGLLTLLSTFCASNYRFQNFTIWNQTEGPERIVVKIDGITIYSGILGTVDYSPSIVVQRPLAFPPGRHRMSVEVPGRHFAKSVEFDVGSKPVNLEVMLNRDDVQVGVSYGNVAYL